MHQWVYTYDSVRDITTTLKHQLLGIFVDGLKYKKMTAKPQYSLLECGIPSNAARVLIEQPFLWEYKFLAFVLRNDFDNLKSKRWNYKYGLIDIPSSTFESRAFLDEIGIKMNEIKTIVDDLSILLNKVIGDAIGEPGVPSDLEMILYTSRQLASKYERLVDWALYFKTLHTDENYNRLLELLYEMPKSALDSIDDFVKKLYEEITSIPDKDDGKKRNISLTCKIDIANQDAIMEEINRLTVLAREGVIHA